jgi:hypothetical protein
MKSAPLVTYRAWRRHLEADRGLLEVLWLDAGWFWLKISLAMLLGASLWNGVARLAGH